MSARDANLLGALGLALADRLAEVSVPEAGGTAAQAVVWLYGRGAGRAIDALAGTVALSHSGTVRLVDRLEADGLVERRRGADQRSTALFLTPAGRRVARRLITKRAAEMQSVLNVLTVDQQAALAGLAESILGELGRAPDAEPRLCRLCDLEACGRTRGDCPVAPRRRRSST